MELKNKTIVITGGATGIGFAIIKALIGDNIVISLDRNPTKIENLKTEIPKVFSIKTDVTSDPDLENAINVIEQEFGVIDILINNAGRSAEFNFVEESEEEVMKNLESEIEINYYTPVKLIKKALPLLQKSKEPCVVNFSTGLIYMPIAMVGGYCASKVALHHITMSIRHQLKPKGIKVVEVMPPTVATDMNKDYDVKKITPEEFAAKFIKGLAKEKETLDIGQTALLKFLSRFLPKSAFNMLNTK